MPVVARQLGIDRIASSGEFPGTIRRVATEPPEPVNYPYLVVSENVEYIQRVDLVVIQNLDKVRERLKKKVRAGTGLEVQVARARTKDAKALAMWLAQVRDLYRFCKLADCKLVMSSGATSPWSMVSGRSFDALLEECGIKPDGYWTELEKWLESRLARKVMT